MGGDTEDRNILNGKCRSFYFLVIPKLLADFIQIGPIDGKRGYESGHLRVGGRQDTSASDALDPFLQITG